VIRITKGQANLVIATTTEVGSASYYLFAFQNLTTLVTQYCIAQDTSAFQGRYNAFTITETVNADPTQAEVEMELEGEWKYTIYSNTNGTNINPTGLTVLETGMCIVTGTNAATPTYTGAPNTYTVYNG
jgi:uncharacterized lipoprotein NlpE involved in copper resistance